MPKGHRGDPIQVDSADDMESDKSGMTLKLRYATNPHSAALLQQSLKFKVLYQAVPLTTGWTLGMTLRPRRGGCDGRCVGSGFENGWGFFLY